MIDDKGAPRKVLERFPWSIESLSAVVKTASMESRVPAIVSLGFVLCCASAAHAQGGAASPSSESPASSLPAPVAADASESIVTDRPDFTSSPRVVPMRFKAQIESGYTFTRSGADREHAIGEILVRVPVAERVELRFGLPSYLFFRSDAQDEGGGDASGFADAFLGAKFASSLRMTRSLLTDYASVNSSLGYTHRISLLGQCDPLLAYFGCDTTRI